MVHRPPHALTPQRFALDHQLIFPELVNYLVGVATSHRDDDAAVA